MAKNICFCAKKINLHRKIRKKGKLFACFCILQRIGNPDLFDSNGAVSFNAQPAKTRIFLSVLNEKAKKCSIFAPRKIRKFSL